MEKEDLLLQKLLQETVEKSEPHLRFTTNVMDEIKAIDLAINKPLIGRLGWLIITVFFIGIITVALIFGWDTKSIDIYSANFDKLGSILDKTSIMFIGVLIGVLLIYADILWRRRKKTTSF